MSLRSVDAVEIVCDGCGGVLLYDGYAGFFRREDAAAWVSECYWQEEDGKHYCCTNAPDFNAAVCWPPSMRDEEVA